MTEDPLERIEREEREKKNRNGGLKTATIVLAAAALALAAALVWIWSQKSSLVNELEEEKTELTQQLLNLQNDFENLNSDYENINSQLDTSREQVALLIDKLSKTEATNRAKIRQYEKELGTLRSIMRGYIVQIDSLNTLNKKLTADAAAARQEAAASRQANENLTRQVENLSGQVAAGSVVKGRGLTLAAYNGSERETDRSSRVTYFLATVTLAANDIAERGPLRVYVRVKDPNGIILLNNNSTDFTYNGETMTASASREVDYEGEDLAVGIYVKDMSDLGKGIYTVEAYTEKASLGRAELMLR
jgi:DNA repair exonuclease SbcCD ATPase subunit